MVHAYLYSALYLLATLLALCARAAPTPALSSLHARQDDNAPFEGPRTVQTRNVIPVTGGSIVEDCVVTFTPIVVDTKNLVREDKQCTEIFVPTGAALPDPPPPITSQDPPSVTTSTPPPPDTTTTPPPAVTTTTPPPPPDTTTSTPPPPANTDTGTLPPPADTNTPPTDSTAPPTDTAPPPQDPAPTSTPTDPNGGTGGATTEGPVLGPSGGSPEGQNTPTSSGEQANSTEVKIPGKGLEVVPIGLGVFAGISVIALIVVGLVTYERTKYRKAFRQRRLAASGQEMGYGGMSERR